MTDETPNPQPLAIPPRGITFFRRLASSIVLWSLIAATVFIFPPWAQYIVVTAVGAIALREVYQLLEKGGLHSFRTSGLVGGIALMTGGWWFYREGAITEQAQHFEACVWIVFVLGVFVRMFPQKNNPHGMATMAATLFGLIYVPWLFSFITKIRFIEQAGDIGRYYVLYLIVVTKFTDTGAYIVGSLVGRHKMIPRISPNKTWEGTVGAVVFAVGVSFLTDAALRSQQIDLGFNSTHLIALGLLLGITAIIGDLAKSQMKREAGVKDSGNMLPGIGGALDLIDSLLFTAPVLYVYLRLVLEIGS